MQNENEILNELKDISPVLAAQPKLNVFTLPAFYFENLPELLLNAVREERIPEFLQGIPKQNTGKVPEGYFEGLAGQILDRVRSEQAETAADEIRVLSPVLESLRGKRVFEVPAGYFEQFKAAMPAGVQTGKAMVVVMKGRMNSFLRYAVAAVFTGLMALGVTKLTQSGKTRLDATVLNGLQINREHSFDQEFEKVADDDIIKYLQANGENIDAQTVAYKTLDESDLPSQEDYLNDEKAVDNYLDNTNAEKLNN